MYQVQYQDGSTVDIPLIHGMNMRDWAEAPSGFASEKGTQSRVAWTGTTKVFPVVCVFQMLWVNPRPESPVKAVRFSNPSAACPVLIAVTAVVKSSPAGQVAAAQAVELYNQAVQALRDGQDAQAETLLKKAVAADPSHAGACQALAQFYDKMKNEDLAFEAYRAWAATGPNTYVPYNRIGQIYEARKQYKQALEAYTRSLQIEWNQPPTIEAKSRMEKLVKD
jgi:Tfp pilus assembly protein PilF